MDAAAQTDALQAVLAALEAATAALRHLHGGRADAALALPSAPSPPSPPLARTAVVPRHATDAAAAAAPEARARVVLALFDYTTLGLEPWRRRGYECHVRAQRHHPRAQTHGRGRWRGRPRAP